MAQEIIKNLNAATVYTLPQQYTTVETDIVDAAAGDSFVTITSNEAYVDYLMTILFRNVTGIQVPKVYILLIKKSDATLFELVSIVSFYRLSATELVLNVGKVLANTYAASDLLTIQTDAQYSAITFQTASYTGRIAVLDQSQTALTAAVPPSFNNNFAGGPPMAIYGAAVTVAVTGGGGDRTSVDPVPPALPLRLTWDAIENAMFTDIGDYNTALGSDFTTLTVDGNDQLLTGNSTTFAMLAEAFLNNTNIVAVNDEAESVISLGDKTFDSCTALTTAIFPACTSVGEQAFLDTFTLTSVNLTLCADLGSTTGNDDVFRNIIGNTITLTIAASRATCDGGNPDGDIVALAANNTATINYV